MIHTQTLSELIADDRTSMPTLASLDRLIQRMKDVAPDPERVVIAFKATQRDPQGGVGMIDVTISSGARLVAEWETILEQDSEG